MREFKTERRTKETDIRVELNLDGKGNSQICTGIPFFNHMLELFVKHSRIDMKLDAVGDIMIDFHHTVEDVGIVLGSAIKEALQEKKGIERYGDALIPMDETLVQTAIDLSGRAYFVYQVPENFVGKIGNFECELVREFFLAFCHHLNANLHIRVLYGQNKHHIAEAIFKSVARALKKAIQITSEEIPSTKGVLV